MPGRTDHRLRMLVLLACVIAFALAAVTRLSYWQVARPDIRQQALAQIERHAVLPAVRGRILDRNGVVLATTGYRDTLVAYPDMIGDSDRAEMVDALVSLLQLNTAERRTLIANLDPNLQWSVLKRELTEAQSQAVRDLVASRRWTELGLEPHPVRTYPAPGGAPGTTIASQLIGFVDVSGAGRYGIEQQYDEQLAGKPTLVKSAQGSPLGSTATVTQQGVAGRDITLTIDSSLQLQLERELYAAWTADKAKRVSALVMDPTSGDILAWASVPGYDANASAKVWSTDPTLFQDPIASQFYEPGSVMKMLTAAAALGNHTVTPDQKVHDVVSLRFGGQRVRNADRDAMGWIPFRDVIAYSRNVATARVGSNLGRNVAKSAAVLYDTWQRFGIGAQTGIDIANETIGIAPDPKNHPWQPIDMANRSFGQSVAVTPIQLATAYTPMINGGLRVQPHFLKAIADQQQPAPAPQRIISHGRARQLKAIMKHVTSAVPWYAQGSLIPGYEVGGKTGTAQIYLQDKGRYAYDTFNFSFIGYVGGDKPAAVVAIRIHEATPRVDGPGQLFLRMTSYQLFRRVALDIIASQEVPRSSDPNAGRPERLSAAEQYLDPQLYERHLKAAKGGLKTQHGR